MISYKIIINVLAICWIITFCLFNSDMELHESWSRGYSECMNDVVEALASHDEVRLGNLIVNEPNTAVTDITFFVVDPNQLGVVLDAADGSVCDCDFNYLGTQE